MTSPTALGHVISGMPEDTMVADQSGTAAAAVKSYDADPGIMTDFFPAPHYDTLPPRNLKP
jgi:hypothetical protein